MAQRGSTSKRTRFKGGVDVTLRGAGSLGNDPLKQGDGTDIGFDIQVPAVTTVNGDAVGQSVNPFQISQPAGTVVFQIDKNLNIAQSGVLSSVQFVAQVTLTAAQLIAMYAAPVAVILAGAVGVGICIDGFTFEMKATATQFTGGGPVALQFGVTADGAGTSVHTGAVAASIIKALGPTSVLLLFGPANAAAGLTIPNDGTTASGIYISNTTAPFAAGTGTAIITVYGSYLTLG